MLLHRGMDVGALNLVPGGIIYVPFVPPSWWVRLPYNGGETTLVLLDPIQQCELATEGAVLVPVLRFGWGAGRAPDANAPMGTVYVADKAAPVGLSGDIQNLLFVLREGPHG